MYSYDSFTVASARLPPVADQFLVDAQPDAKTATIAASAKTFITSPFVMGHHDPIQR
ncbi:hypothetical protein XFF6960_730002 [Xanthomonas citri pv. fuscans]|nr:hypothetical protein XFF6960_730002 [Xanthomonas citri pv. fuscans]